jgi:hypothetical protein
MIMRQIQKIKSSTRKPVPETDTRTPSGKPLPY